MLMGHSTCLTWFEQTLNSNMMIEMISIFILYNIIWVCVYGIFDRQVVYLNGKER